MTRRKVEIIRDGLVLRGELDQEGADRPLVILMHGFGGSMGKTDREILPVLNEKLLEAGFQTFRFDFDGHGSSDGAMKDMDILREILDAIAVLQYAERLPHAGKISLMGHSQGGVVASMLAGLYHDRMIRIMFRRCCRSGRTKWADTTSELRRACRFWRLHPGSAVRFSSPLVRPMKLWIRDRSIAGNQFTRMQSSTSFQI